MYALCGVVLLYNVRGFAVTNFPITNLINQLTDKHYQSVTPAQWFTDKHYQSVTPAQRFGHEGVQSSPHFVMPIRHREHLAHFQEHWAYFQGILGTLSGNVRHTFREHHAPH
jgi:hypothetical protein